ncbi:hypothetical protein BDB00DRAFT_449753 [Zychaea mexicana]|uniref:uncharacterized protein n=1 Tax=Zychaea mexicana TaxID=64656 RepID=UPI0022FDD363|nr:uncharacterized protein BDB00DRAFT_449753 [Zychaea mexicana]KAI9498462.1 hypothetical protein BDB00DRAFT_449753 [Zychaea mexicana]
MSCPVKRKISNHSPRPHPQVEQYQPFSFVLFHLTTLLLLLPLLLLSTTYTLPRNPLFFLLLQPSSICCLFIHRHSQRVTLLLPLSRNIYNRKATHNAYYIYILTSTIPYPVLFPYSGCFSFSYNSVAMHAIQPFPFSL